MNNISKQSDNTGSEDHYKKSCQSLLRAIILIVVIFTLETGLGYFRFHFGPFGPLIALGLIIFIIKHAFIGVNHGILSYRKNEKRSINWIFVNVLNMIILLVFLGGISWAFYEVIKRIG